ncbi:AAA family ATPase [Nitratidesulfovibrio vulgaris]|uniref:AAA family ATPase n=1 Tax=Nitratidesulfovibrio vulgaris TaxID=881 RepID=UPI0013DF7994|nr:ATP-binding protein [Nitratidesulfovibrio vulgaris]
MKKGILIETDNVTRLRAAVKQAEDTERGRPGMVAVWGEAGAGKTIAAHSLYAQRGGVFLRAMEGMSQHAFLQELCWEVKGTRPHGSHRCRADILRALEEDPATVYVDEADRLDLRRLEDLRDIHDITGCPVVLIGEQHLPGKLAERTRIDDRIPEEYRVPFSGITPRDVSLFALEAAEIVLTPGAAGLIHKQAKGNFRRIHNLMLSVESAARAHDTTEVDEALVRAAMPAARSSASRAPRRGQHA